MKIKTITDVITNSSSEVFAIKTNKTAQEILDELLAIKNPDEGCSGDGGTLTVKTKDGFVGGYYDPFDYMNLPENYAMVQVDQGFEAIINYLTPKHCKYIEDAGELLYNIDWFIDYYSDMEEIDPIAVQVYPGIKDKLMKLIKSLTKIYENTFNN